MFRSPLSKSENRRSLAACIFELQPSLFFFKMDITVMDKHLKACKQHPSSLLTSQSTKSFYLPNNKFKKKLISSKKRKLTNTPKERYAVNSLPLTLFPGSSFKELDENLLNVGRQLGATVSIDEAIIHDLTTIDQGFLLFKLKYCLHQLYFSNGRLKNLQCLPRTIHFISVKYWVIS